MGCGLKTPSDTKHLTIREENLTLGLDDPMDIVFLADTHISLCDDRDDEVRPKASVRYEAFLSPDGLHADEIFNEEIDYVKHISPDLLVLGGDITDSAMYASVDFVKDSVKRSGVEYLYGMGNHDFEYGDEYFSDRAYEEYLPRLSEVSATMDGYQTKEYEGFIILVVDDNNNQVSEGALSELKRLCSQSKPVILFTHVPIEPREPYRDELTSRCIEKWGAYDDGRCKVLMGPGSVIPNEVTGEFIDLVLSDDSNVRLVLSGHVHFYDRSELREGLTQIITGAGYEGEMIHLHLR